MNNKLKIYPNFILVLCLLLFLPKIHSSQNHTSWSYNLGVYEVNIRQYTQQGTFAAFETHLERLKELGVGILWFMPIHPIGEVNRLGSLGSYYSVKDYKAVNPEFGTMNDFKNLVNKAHEMGFYVLIDWVANHTAWDNPLTISNPDWFTKDGNGNFIPPAGTNWSDVIDLDFSKQGLRDYMIDAMKFWITETDIDGFRCDAASMVPMEFWSAAIDELKTIKPDILMLAEADGSELQDAGFDMTFAWEFYGFGNGILSKIIAGTNTANNLASFLRGEFQDFHESHYRMYFTSNHDENSWEGTVFERFGAASEIFAAITHTINDVPLIYSGQEAGLNKRLKFFDKDQITWREHRFDSVYKTLLSLKKVNKALWNGPAGGKAERILTNNNPAVFAFIREKENDKIFAVFNVTSETQTIIPEGELHLDSYIDVFTNDTITFTGGSELTLNPWGYSILSAIQAPTDLPVKEEIPHEYVLGQNYPNPFNPSTTIKYSVPVEGKNVALKVFDMLGREVITLAHGNQPSGNYEVQWDAANYPSGIYYCRLFTPNYSKTIKMLLLK